MKCKNPTVFIAMLLLVAFQAVSQNPEQLAAKAAKSYNNLQFADAIAQYEKIISSGYESYSLYYNLGNAYFRNNELAHAVLNYEKALKIAPNNENILHNIGVVNSKLVDKVETIPELFYIRWWKQLLNLMDIETQSILNIVLFTFGLSLIAVYIAANNLAIRKISFWTGIAFLLLFGVGSIAASQRNHYLTEHHEAIVFSQTVNIKSSPDENSKDIFVLHEGIKVTLLDVVADWQEIRIANGSVGWIKTLDIKKI